MPQKLFKQQGFTLLEIVIALGITVLAISLMTNLGLDISNFGNFFGDFLGGQQEIQLSFQIMSSEFKSARRSSAGSFPIAAASPSSLTFYSDIDGDNIADQVRYFTEGAILKRGTIKPSGLPLVYNSANEKISEMIHGLTASSSTPFYYYDKDFTGSENPLSYPLDLSAIRVVKVKVSMDENPQAEPGPIDMEVYLTGRNLKSTL